MEELLQYYSEMIPTYMSVIALGIVLLEWIVLTIIGKIEKHKEGRINIISAILTFVPIVITNQLLTIFVMFWVYQYRIFDLGFEWYVWILAYVGYDFMSYATHWFSHKVRFFWCIHSVHHSPEEMKSSVSFRGSFAEFLLAPHIILWLPLLGFHPFVILIVEGVGQLYGVLLHVNKEFVPKVNTVEVKKLLITPATHRLHHAKNEIYLDTNYGLMFSLWDRIFKTAQVEVNDVDVSYGLMKDIDSDNLIVAQTDEFVSLWKDRKSAPLFIDKIK